MFIWMVALVALYHRTEMQQLEATSRASQAKYEQAKSESLVQQAEDVRKRTRLVFREEWP